MLLQPCTCQLTVAPTGSSPPLLCPSCLLASHQLCIAQAVSHDGCAACCELHVAVEREDDQLAVEHAGAQVGVQVAVRLVQEAGQEVAAHLPG